MKKVWISNVKNMVTIVDNTVLYNQNLLRIECKCSNQNIHTKSPQCIQFYQLYLNKAGKNKTNVLKASLDYKLELIRTPNEVKRPPSVWESIHRALGFAMKTLCWELFHGVACPTICLSANMIWRAITFHQCQILYEEEQNWQFFEHPNVSQSWGI